MTDTSTAGRPGSLATESYSADQALTRMPEVRAKVGRLVRRLQRYVPIEPGSRVLDVGAAQGLYVAALCEAGLDAVGVEPWAEAREVSQRVADRTGHPLKISSGTAESLPYGDQEFDLVVATSVMEHAADPLRAVQEAHRVLRPGGGFYFWTTSILCPRQHEIMRFPAFSWYPDPVKKRIMNWAAKSRPSLIGHTSTPALNWFSPARSRRLARAAGFAAAYERWDLIRPDELSPRRARILKLVGDRTLLRRAADVLIEGSSYLFVK